MDINVLYKFLKYVIIWIVIYFSTKNIDKQLEVKDVLIITCVLTILVYVIDTVFNTVRNCIVNTDYQNKFDEHIEMYKNMSNKEDAPKENVVLQDAPKEQPIVPKEQPIVPKEQPIVPVVSQDDGTRVLNRKDFRGAENWEQIHTDNGTRNDLLNNNMRYSDFDRFPPNIVKNDYEMGYSFMPPKDWYPTPLYPPVCVTNNPSTVQPVYLDTMTMDLKHWHETTKITPPDTFNTDYIINELNSR